MGGSTMLGIREKDGTVHRFYPNNKSLPWIINNIGLIEKNSEHLPRVIADQQLWLSKYEPGPAILAPSSYGLVVIDYREGIILSAADFAPGSFDDVYFRQAQRMKQPPESKGIALRHQGWRNLIGTPDEKSPTLLTALVEAGKISHYDFDTKLYTTVTSFDQELDWTDAYLQADMSPWRMWVKLSYSIESGEPFKEALTDVGFQFTSEEEEVWDTYIAEINGSANGNLCAEALQTAREHWAQVRKGATCLYNRLL